MENFVWIAHKSRYGNTFSRKRLLMSNICKKKGKKKPATVFKFHRIVQFPNGYGAMKRCHIKKVQSWQRISWQYCRYAGWCCRTENQSTQCFGRIAVGAHSTLNTSSTSWRAPTGTTQINSNTISPTINLFFHPLQLLLSAIGQHDIYKNERINDDGILIW